MSTGDNCLRVISNESVDFNDPKEFDDPRYTMIPVIRWTLIIQKSTVIPPSPMVLFFLKTSRNAMKHMINERELHI